jgi:glycolate oxidase iron-sulfur subunit
MMNIEEKNAKEEIIEIVEKCIKCGLCKELCPVFRVLREEQSSPRGHAILLANKIEDSFVFDCTLCKACEEKCPMSLKLCTAIRKAREVMNLKERGNLKVEEMKKRLLEGKNPYD